jgi:hypothetical protein
LPLMAAGRQTGSAGSTSRSCPDQHRAAACRGRADAAPPVISGCGVRGMGDSRLGAAPQLVDLGRSSRGRGLRAACGGLDQEPSDYSQGRAHRLERRLSVPAPTRTTPTGGRRSPGWTRWPR